MVYVLPVSFQRTNYCPYLHPLIPVLRPYLPPSRPPHRVMWCICMCGGGWLQAKLVFATVSTAGRSEMLSAAGRSGFDVAVLDEASQVSDGQGDGRT